MMSTTIRQKVAVVVLVEEIGKVARPVNKIGMAADDSIAPQWRDEQNQRIITSISILQRHVSGGHRTMPTRPVQTTCPKLRSTAGTPSNTLRQ